MNVLAIILPVALSLTPACVFEEDWLEGEADDIGELDLEGRVVNGRVINGRVINGRVINGTAYSGYIVSVSLDHVLLGSVYVNGVSLVKSKFTSGTKTGTAFNGAIFDATLSEGEVIPLRITAVRQAAPDLWAYKIAYQDDGNWISACTSDTGAEVEAYPLNGVWNHDEGVPGGGGRTTPSGKFTFACRTSGALGKCVDFGYVPWRTLGKTSLLNYHDACVRAVRADWCGDGRTGTEDGNLINLFDKLQVQKDTESWPGEAEWSPNGATCLNKQRVSAGELRGEVFPECARIKQRDLCGNGFTQQGSLAATEYLLQ